MMELPPKLNPSIVPNSDNLEIPTLQLRTYEQSQYKECCPNCKRAIRKLKSGWKCYECHTTVNLPLNRYMRLKLDKRRSGRESVPLTQTQISTKINSIDDPQWRAFFSLLYLSGCRISEIIPYTKKGLEGLKRGQIETQDFDGKTFLVLKNVPILKRRYKIYKNIPLPTHYETSLIQNVQDFIKPISEDTILFPFYRQKVFRASKKYFGKDIFPHLWRHYRASILVSDYGLDESRLVHFIGWHDSRMASTYVHLNWEDIARKMR